MARQVVRTMLKRRSSELLVPWLLKTHVFEKFEAQRRRRRGLRTGQRRDDES